MANKTNRKPNSDSGERPEKYLSRLGIASRREIARWVDGGRLAVDGHVLRGGERVAPGARLTLDGVPLSLPRSSAPRRVILYNKPLGEEVTRREIPGRPSVFAALPPVTGGRWVAVGRLDVNTSGLLLFTTDGALAARLMHPRHRVKRRYAVRVRGRVSAGKLAALTSGVMLEDGPARLDECIPMGRSEGSNRWFQVTLREGRNREVRRLFEAVELEVGRLRRIGYGPIMLPRGMAPGTWRELDRESVARLDAATA